MRDGDGGMWKVSKNSMRAICSLHMVLILNTIDVYTIILISSLAQLPQRTHLQTLWQSFSLAYVFLLGSSSADHEVWAPLLQIVMKNTLRSVEFKVMTDSDNNNLVKIKADHAQLMQLIENKKVGIVSIKYDMPAEQLERLQVTWTTRNYRMWVLSLPIAMTCDFEGVTVNITFGIQVVVQQRGAYGKPQWVKCTDNGQYIVETTGVLCAGFFRRRDKNWWQWLGWNWHWSVEVLSVSDCLHDFNMLVF